MAIVPRGAENVRMNVSAPVPVGSSEARRVSGEAIESFGKGLQQFGAQQLEFDRTLKRDEAEGAFKNLNKEAELYANQNAKEDGSDYVDKYREHFDSKKSDILAKYAEGDPRLQNQIGSMSSMIGDHGLTNAKIKSALMQEDYNFKRLDKTLDTRADSIRENPTEERLNSELLSFTSTLHELEATGAIKPTNIAKVLAHGQSRMAEAYIEGLGNIKNYPTALNALQANQEDPSLYAEMDPDAASNTGLITSTEASSLKENGASLKIPIYTKGDKVKLSPALTKLMQSFTPERKAQLIDRLSAKAQADVQLRMSDLNASVSGFEEVATSGQFSSRQMRDFAKKIKEDMANMPNLNVESKLRVAAKVDSVLALGEQVNLAQSVPKTKWAGIAANFDKKLGISGDTNPATLGIKLDAKQKLMSTLNSLSSQWEKDGVTAALKSNPDVYKLYLASKDKDVNPEGAAAYVKYLDAVTDQQKYLGIRNVRTTTVAEADQMVQFMKTSTDPSTMNQYLSTIQNQFGKHAPMVMDELKKVDEAMGDYKVIMHTPPEGREGLVDAVMNKDAINKQYKEVFKENTEEINSAVDSKLQNFNSSIIGASNNSSGISYLNSVRDQVMLRAKRDLIKNPALSATEAVQSAFDSIVGNNFHVVSAKGSKIIVPKNIGNAHIPDNAEPLFRSFLSVNSTPEAFKQLGVDAPKSYKAMTKKEIDQNLGMTAQGVNTLSNPSGIDVYYRQLAQRARWVPNSSLTGIKLMWQEDDGTVSQVFGKNKLPIEKSYVEIYTKPSKEVLDDSKGFLGRLFNGI